MKKKILLVPVFIFILLISVSTNNVKINRKIYKDGNQETIYEEWIKRFKDSDEFRAVFNDEDGYEVVGTRDGLEFGNIVKYNFDGDILWQKHITKNYIRRLKFAIKLSDGYLIGGKDNGAGIYKFDKYWNYSWYNYKGEDFGTYNSAIETLDGYVVVGDIDGAYIVKYNKDGEELWHFNSFERANSCEFYSIVEVEDGYVTVGECGTSNYEISGYYDAIILKIDKNGNYLWSNEWGGKGNEDFTTVAEDSDGIIAIGNSGGAYVNSVQVFSDSGKGAVIVKYDKYGEMLWNKIYNYGDNNQNYYSFHSATKVEDGYLIGGLDSGKGDMFLKIDEQGNIIWEKNFKFGSQDRVNSLIKVEDGYIVVGSSYNSSDSFIAKFTDEVKIENSIINDDNDGKTYKTYNIGDIIKYQGEDYYIIGEDSSSNNYLTLLKSEPLTNDDLDKFASGIKFEKGEKYGLVPYFSNSTCNSKDNESGCTNRYEDSDIKKILDNWANEFNDDLVKVDGYKVRLLKYYNVGFASTNDGTCIHTVDVPNWLHNNYYSYWSMNTIDDTEDSVIVFGNDSTRCTQEVYKAKAVRPVINLKKCVIEDNCPVDEPEEEPEKTIIETKVEPEKEKTIIEAENTFKTVSYIVIIIGSLLIIGGYIFYKRIKKEVKW